LHTSSFIIQIKWDTFLYLLPSKAALYVRPLYINVTTFDVVVQGYHTFSFFYFQYGK